MGTFRGSEGVTKGNRAISDAALAQAVQDAEDSATSALNSESAAATSEGEAAQSATDAATAATGAEATELSAAEILDEMDDLYLGSKASDPTLDNDGDALVTGALYWNSTNDVMRVYDGAAWSDFIQFPTQATTKGNILVGDGTDWIVLAVGADDEVLTADSTQASGIKWAVPAA